MNDAPHDLALVRTLKAQAAALEAENERLKGGGGDGTSGGMESRIATLEAHMEQVKESLAKLASVPEDLATLKERTSHLSTKAELHTEITTQLDRLGTRLQRQVVITGSIFTAILALITLADRILK